MSTRPAAHTGNSALFIILALAYFGLLILFGIQTWLFVDWLFPDDQLLMKVLTVISFDFMAVLWACLESFYIFVDRASHSLVKWAWGITFLLSLVASVLYMILQSMFRFHVAVTPDLINLAYGITITALVFNIICITFFIRHEWMIRHPRNYAYEPFAVQEEKPKQLDAPLPTFSSRPEQTQGFQEELEALRRMKKRWEELDGTSSNSSETDKKKLKNRPSLKIKELDTSELETVRDVSQPPKSTGGT